MTLHFLIYPAAFISGMPGGGELIVLFLVVLVLFGPKKLPEIARMIGRTLDQLRTASQDFKDEVMKIEDEVREDIKTATKDVIDVPVTDFDDEDPDAGMVGDAIIGLPDDGKAEDVNGKENEDEGSSREEEKDLAG